MASDDGFESDGFELDDLAIYSDEYNRKTSDDTDFLYNIPEDNDMESTTTGSTDLITNIVTRKTADVWKYYNFDLKRPICKNCGKVFSNKTGNSSLERHLIKFHNISVVKDKRQTNFTFQPTNPHSAATARDP